MIEPERRLTVSEAGLTGKDIEPQTCSNLSTATAKASAKLAFVLEGRRYVCVARNGSNGADRWVFAPLLTLPEWEAECKDLQTFDKPDEVPNYSHQSNPDLCGQRQATVGHNCGLLVWMRRDQYRIGPYGKGVIIEGDNWAAAKNDFDEWNAAGRPEWWIWMTCAWRTFSWSNEFRSRDESSARAAFKERCENGWNRSYPWMQKDKPFPGVVLLDPNGCIADIHFPPGNDRAAYVKAMNYFMGWDEWTPERQASLLASLPPDQTTITTEQVSTPTLFEEVEDGSKQLLMF